MTPPYENVYLGNFIFALGFLAAKTSEGLSNKAVQLVQQTPDEAKLNDLFVNWGGKNFIFEFKRNANKISAELDKEAKLLLNTALNSADYEYESLLSKKSHFLGFGLENGLAFIPYKSIHLDTKRNTSLGNFCSAMLSTEYDLGINHEELTHYLEFIGSITGSETEGCGGFILNISSDGTLSMVPFETVSILSQTIDETYAPPAPSKSFDWGMQP